MMWRGSDAPPVLNYKPDNNIRVQSTPVRLSHTVRLNKGIVNISTARRLGLSAFLSLSCFSGRLKSNFDMRMCLFGWYRHGTIALGESPCAEQSRHSDCEGMVSHDISHRRFPAVDCRKVRNTQQTKIAPEFCQFAN